MFNLKLCRRGTGCPAKAVPLLNQLWNVSSHSVPTTTAAKISSVWAIHKQLNMRRHNYIFLARVFRPSRTDDQHPAKSQIIVGWRRWGGRRFHIDSGGNRLGCETEGRPTLFISEMTWRPLTPKGYGRKLERTPLYLGDQLQSAPRLQTTATQQPEPLYPSHF